MLEILGETLATGRYSFHGGLEDEEDIQAELDYNDTDNESQIEPSLRSNTTSAINSAANTRLSTPRLSTSDSQATQSIDDDISETP
jgi:hypothetical protein